MCGRFVSAQQPDVLASFFGASFEADALPANFNVAPTNDVYGVVADASGARHIETFQWGLVPSWAKDVKIGSKMINARAETIAEKPAFRSLLKQHRVIVPMDGFFEWQAAGEGAPVGKGGKPIKTPKFIHRVDGTPLAVAGLWAKWRDREGGPDAPWLHTLTVITTAANETMAPVHDRMPVILPATTWDLWLDGSVTSAEQLLPLLAPAANDILTMHTVSTDVNNVRNKGEHLIAPAPAPE